MNQDLIVLATLIGFPIGSWALFVLGSKLSRKLSCRECPYCFEQISKNVWHLSIPCPECGVFPESGERPRTDPSRQSCRRCGEPASCRTIWDGHPYCVRCLSEASTDLPAAAEAPVLVDSLPTSSGAAIWRMLGFSSLIVAGFAGTIAALVLLCGQPWQFALESFAVILLIGSPMILAFTWGAARAPAIVRLRTMAWNGQLLVLFGDHIFAAPLAHCVWQEGRIQDMVGWNFCTFLRGPVLLIDLPTETKGRLRRVPVGFTDDSRSLWRAFFELADVPRASP
jgi:hypothetical protein